jgi:hypothetical protein
MASPLSALPPRPRERMIAYIVLAISTAIFVLLAPFAQVKLQPWPQFIPIYQGLLFVSDMLTAGVFLVQFRYFASRALLFLGAAYLFTALAVVPHTLSFPGLFAPDGLMGSGPQTTAWLYMFWHAGFPLLVLGYALTRHDARPIKRAAMALGLAVVGCAAVVTLFTLLATQGHRYLPAVMAGNGYTLAMLGAMSAVWALSFVALAVLWLRGPHSALDLWMMVVLAAWIFDIGLSAALNAGRYDLGFYSGRIYGLFAGMFVLIMLLRERRLSSGRAGPSGAA